MKKFFVVSMIIAVGLALSCGQKIGEGMVENGKVVKTEQWVDDNTFRIVGAGAPMADETDPFIMKQMGAEAATVNAQVKIIEKFLGARVEGASGVKNFRSTGTAAAKTIEGAIKGGSVEWTNCDETGHCTVIYQVKAKGLKKSITDVKMGK